MAQYPGPNAPKGPGKSTTSMGADRGGVAQDTLQNRQAGLMKPGQTNGAGISASPSMNISGDDYKSSNMNTNTGSGSRPTRSMYPIGTSAPTDAHTLNRAPAGWLK